MGYGGNILFPLSFPDLREECLRTIQGFEFIAVDQFPDSAHPLFSGRKISSENPVSGSVFFCMGIVKLWTPKILPETKDTDITRRTIAVFRESGNVPEGGQVVVLLAITVFNIFNTYISHLYCSILETTEIKKKENIFYC
jgi:hypothetical protein